MNFIISNSGIANFRNLRMIGLSTKNSDDKIGQFGSGFKYGMALLVRKGIFPTIYIGKEKIDVSVEDDEIVYIKNEEKIHSSIHINLGQYDWTDLWQALREFICNAVDEDKNCAYYIGKNVIPEDGVTTIVIPMQNGLQVAANLALNRFLFGETPIYKIGKDSVYEGSDIYKKGVFIKQLNTVFKYSFNELKISESRTADAYSISSAFNTMFNNASKEFIFEFLRNKKKENIEDQWYIHVNNKEFNLAIKEVYGDKAVVCINSDEVIKLATLGYTPIQFQHWTFGSDIDTAAALLRDKDKLVTSRPFTDSFTDKLKKKFGDFKVKIFEGEESSFRNFDTIYINSDNYGSKNNRLLVMLLAAEINGLDIKYFIEYLFDNEFAEFL